MKQIKNIPIESDSYDYFVLEITLPEWAAYTSTQRLFPTSAVNTSSYPPSSPTYSPYLEDSMQWIL